ncbi:MAG: hypothetical protein A2W19_05795 [Spirochaetes bacterium RBG_16_49_21]|nr:MAG: hypothetical protein A2W19_05795 [Spirochaetes bacterium RBG_16_49_21]
MKKTIIGKDVYYTLAWSPTYRYDKYEALRVMPELSGIISLMYINQSKIDDLIFYSCHRDGCRVGFKRFMDPDSTRYAEIIRELDLSRLYYKYTLVDEGSMQDVQDILYWLIRTYRPRFNESDFRDSQRFYDIYVNEVYRDKNDVVERIVGHRGY